MALSIGVPMSAQAEDSPPFSLPCPSVLKCARGEAGMWVPTGYLRGVKADSVRLEGTQKELARAGEQIHELELAAEQFELQTRSLKDKVVVVEASRAVQTSRIDHLERQKTRRTRWALATTVLTVLLIGALSAVAYAGGA